MKPKPPPRKSPAAPPLAGDGPPRRVTPPPFKLPAPNVRTFDADRFMSEPPTKQKNMTASIYQSLLSVFDEMTDEQRMEFVDLASVYAALDAAARKDLVDLLPLYGRLRPEERQVVLESIHSFEPTRRR